MSDEDLDPIETLRDAWMRLDAPEPSTDLSKCDPETARTVRWLQDAWATVEVPAVPVFRAAPAPKHGRRAAIVAVAAAAAVIAIVAIRASDTGRRLPLGRGPARDAVAEAKEVRREPDRLPPQPERTAASVAVGEVRDEIALRSGPVRLVLVTATETELSN